MIFEPNAELLKKIQGGINYDANTIEPYTPERSYYYQTLAGPTSDAQRFPYNTIYVSSDLLLHNYHKLFSNSLKEYEMTTARNLISSEV